MTCIEIEVALHYYYSPEPWGEHHTVSIASQEATRKLLAAGLIETQGSDYKATDGLTCYIEALQAVPFPKRIWKMPTEFEV